MFKTKLLVAVLALGVSASASARFDVTGNSEFAFSAWDSAAGVGYTYDLEDIGFDSIFGSNVRLNSFIGTSHTTSSLNTSLVQGGATGVLFDLALPSFSDFLSQANAANVSWNLVAIDVSGLKRIIQTVSTDPANAQTNKQIHEASAATDQYFGAVNSKGTHVSADDGTAVTVASDLAAYAGATTYAGNFGGKGYANSGSLDDALNMWVFGQTNTGATSSAAGKFGQLMDATGNAVSAKVYMADDGLYHLQISAVPEPETYAMLLAGLGLIGAAARRRRA